MKVKLKITFYSILSILTLGITKSIFSCRNYWVNKSDGNITDNNLSYFRKTYEECRSSFRNATQKAGKKYTNVEIGNIIIKSEIDNDLTVDWCYIPAQNKRKKLLILTSGVHGIEGYTGSAVQLMFMDKIVTKELLDETGVLLIHGLNPYGFKYHRKVTENNIDLNRNCVTNTNGYMISNKEYEAISDLLIPINKYSCNLFKKVFFYISVIHKIIKNSKQAVRQATLKGQYDFNKGIFYGGNDLEPQIKAMEQIFKAILPDYSIALNIDLHTGYGKRGKMYFFLNPTHNKKVKNALEFIFKDEKIYYGNNKDFYTISGDYVGWISQLSKKTLCLPMLFEFGTLNSHETFGGIKCLHIMISENQGLHYDYKDQYTKEKVKHNFVEMYYPSSKAWRSKAISDSHNSMLKMMKQLKSYKVVKDKVTQY